MSFQDRLIWLGERLKYLEDRLDEPQSSAGRRRKSDIEFSALPLGHQEPLATSGHEQSSHDTFIPHCGGSNHHDQSYERWKVNLALHEPWSVSVQVESGRGAELQASQRKENQRKNRYFDVLPSEDSRVILSGAGYPMEDGSDYINASHILVPGNKAHPAYIAAQGPLDRTVEDFWHMAWQEQCTVVVSLTRAVEGHRVKCSNYFPGDEGDTAVYGSVSVTNTATSTLDCCILQRNLRLENTQIPGQVYEVTHYHYLEWPDHGVPSCTKLIRSLLRHLRGMKYTGPFLIHCSAGIGRTGTFCTIDLAVRKLLAGDEGGLDIPGIVALLRTQRPGMVQTKEQYRFCYGAVRDELADILKQTNIDGNEVAS